MYHKNLRKSFFAFCNGSEPAKFYKMCAQKAPAAMPYYTIKHGGWQEGDNFYEKGLSGVFIFAVWLNDYLK